MKVIGRDDKEYPKRLLEIKNAPEKLYIEGNAELLNNNCLAIVGSRNCSEYGIKYAKEFAKEIAEHNITIISGLAIGIDTAAHEMAKDCIGNTIAVLGCGLNFIYPEENQELFKEILKKGGCIISEYEPDKQVNMKNFPKRNRIISGISNGVLVIEAEYRSGSTITGRRGIEQGRNVFCLPRDIGVSRGVGTNDLIKLGAKLVTSPTDILKEFGFECDQKEDIVETEDEMPKVSEEYMSIYNCITYNPNSIQSIAKQSGLGIVEAMQKVTMLELQGYIKNLPGNYYVRV